MTDVFVSDVLVVCVAKCPAVVYVCMYVCCMAVLSGIVCLFFWRRGLPLWMSVILNGEIVSTDRAVYQVLYRIV